MRLIHRMALAASISLLGVSSVNAASEKLCITVFDQTNPYWVNLVKGFKQRAAEVGADVNVTDPSGDSSKQVSAIENFVTAGCKAIVVAALDPPTTQGPIETARAAGIKVIAQSMKTPVSDVWVSADERDMGYVIGKEAGRWISEKLGGKAKVLTINNDRIPQMIIRKKGIKEGISELAPKAEFVADQPAGSTAEALTVTESVLQAHPDLSVIVAVNDDSALGALAALESSGIDTKNFFVGGVDATSEARAKIGANTAFRASVDNVPFDNGRKDVDIAIDLINGKKLEYKQVIPVKAYTGQ